MKRCNKLRSARGETLTETLMAVLIVGLASVMLAAMIGSASRMNRTALQKDAAYLKALSQVESGTDTGETEGRIVVEVEGTETATLDVTYRHGEGDALVDYEVTP